MCIISPLSSPPYFRALIETIVDLKSDAYMDLLEIIAYGSSKSRLAALSILAAFYPRAIGHLSVADPLPRLDSKQSEAVEVSPWTHPARGNVVVATPRGQKNKGRDDAHVFVPWKYAGGSAQCLECGKLVEGFGLRCITGHHDPVHFNCLNTKDASFMSHYVTDTGMNRIAAPRFSYIPAELNGQRMGQKSASESRFMPTFFEVANHAYRLVNCFTLMICFCCRKPLWGTTAQGYKCNKCFKFAHWTCLQSLARTPHEDASRCVPADSSPVKEISIDWTDLRKDFLAHFKPIVMNESQLKNRTHEDVLIFYTQLWIQLHLLEYGIAAGTILVNQSGPLRIAAATESMDNFELHYLVQLYEAYIAQAVSLYFCRQASSIFTVLISPLPWPA
ncbi:hypothetical protein BT69DRAFT_140619 [Atractiella rhizophila]|nr:hypothetical protein BT69DRAFT_140619 [Atractiella rhizophila]